MIKDSDCKQIADICNYYIQNTVITFEEKTVTEDEMKHRIQKFTQLYPWLVCEEDNRILGYAYASNFRAYSAYKHSVELTVYVNKKSQGKGVGTLLYTELFKLLRQKNVHAMFAVITIPNEKSQKLHEKMGFKKVGQLKEAGIKFNKWLDVGYWEYKF